MLKHGSRSTMATSTLPSVGACQPGIQGPGKSSFVFAVTSTSQCTTPGRWTGQALNHGLDEELMVF